MPSPTGANLPLALASLHTELGISPEYLAARGLRLYPEATGTVLADRDPDDGKEVRLVPGAAAAWVAMRDAAAAAGVTLWACSGFRSYGYQAELVRRKLAEGVPLDEALAVVAPPGCSEHHAGRAVDIATPESERLEADFADTPAFAWLSRHAAEHGFELSFPEGNAEGFEYEPWHWRWSPGS